MRCIWQPGILVLTFLASTAACYFVLYVVHVLWPINLSSWLVLSISLSQNDHHVCFPVLIGVGQLVPLLDCLSIVFRRSRLGQVALSKRAVLGQVLPCFVRASLLLCMFVWLVRLGLIVLLLCTESVPPGLELPVA